LHSRTASALNSAVNVLLFRFPMAHSSRSIALAGVSTEAGELQALILRRRATR
jgi:hypothetical protein